MHPAGARPLSAKVHAGGSVHPAWQGRGSPCIGSGRVRQDLTGVAPVSSNGTEGRGCNWGCREVGHPTRARPGPSRSGLREAFHETGAKVGGPLFDREIAGEGGRGNDGRQGGRAEKRGLGSRHPGSGVIRTAAARSPRNFLAGGPIRTRRPGQFLSALDRPEGPTCPPAWSERARVPHWPAGPSTPRQSDAPCWELSEPGRHPPDACPGVIKGRSSLRPAPRVLSDGCASPSAGRGTGLDPCTRFSHRRGGAHTPMPRPDTPPVGRFPAVIRGRAWSPLIAFV